MKLQFIESYNQYLFEQTPDHTISKAYATENFQIKPYTRMTEEEYLSIKDDLDFLHKVTPGRQLGADHQPFRMRVMIKALNQPNLRVKYQFEERRISYQFISEVDSETKTKLARELKEIEIIICQNWDAFTDYANDKALYAVYDRL